jgi:ribosomal small subunit protein bTHX
VLHGFPKTYYFCRPLIQIHHQKLQYRIMGKGDFKSKRGKISRGSHGKNRPKLKKLKTVMKNLAEKETSKKA